MRFKEFEPVNEAMPKWIKNAAIAGALAVGTPTAFNDIPKNNFQAESPLHQNLEILRQTIWGEARQFDATGMIAVGSVILNRVHDIDHHKLFGGNNLKDIVLKNKQFSCWKPGDPNYKRAQQMKMYDRIIKTQQAPNNEDFRSWLKKFENTGDYLDYKKWLESLRIAQELLAGNLSDPTHGATYYHTKDVHPIWSKKLQKIGSFGSHVFYKLPKQHVDI